MCATAAGAATSRAATAASATSAFLPWPNCVLLPPLISLHLSLRTRASLPPGVNHKIRDAAGPCGKLRGLGGPRPSGRWLGIDHVVVGGRPGAQLLGRDHPGIE